MSVSDTLVYHCDCVGSHWIGCPISPEFLSDTLLTTVRTPPLSLIGNAVPSIASFRVLASLIFVFSVRPETIV